MYNRCFKQAYDLINKWMNNMHMNKWGVELRINIYIYKHIDVGNCGCVATGPWSARLIGTPVDNL